MQRVADGAFTVFHARESSQRNASRIRGKHTSSPPGTPLLLQAPHDMNARRASRTPARHLTVLLGTLLLSLSSQTPSSQTEPHLQRVGYSGTRTANGPCTLHALRGGGGTHDASALSPPMKEVGAFSPRVSSPVLHALVLRDLAESTAAADTDDVRTQFRMLSCAAASVPTAVAREVLRLGSLRHLVGRLEEHDAVFREGAQIYHRLVVDAFDHASLAARQGVGLENLPAFRKELLQALELGLDSRKVHVRQAVVEAFLAAFSRLESAWPGAGASGLRPFSILTGYGQHGKFGGHDADDANRVLAQALAIRARCDADIADAGPLLCDFLTQTDAAPAEGGIAAAETCGDDVMMLLLEKAESRHEHVRNAVSRALECCFRRRQDRGLEWLLAWVHQRYTSALPEGPAAGGRVDPDADQGKRQMSLPPTRERSLAPGEALRRRLAAQDDSFDPEGRTAAPAWRQASSLDLSILHAKKAGKQAAAPDTKKHVRAAAMLVLRAWVRSQGEGEGEAPSTAADDSQVTASMCRVLEWLLARPSPVADPAASVGRLARAAAVQVGIVAAAVGGQHGALALMGVIQVCPWVCM